MTLDQIMQQIEDFDCRLVEITGGEPLLQQEVYALMDRLLVDGYQVMLETSGERLIDRIPEKVFKIVDVKCPDSGAANTFNSGNIQYLNPHDEVKFVIASRQDYEFARAFTSSHQLCERVSSVIFSPVHEAMAADEMARWMLEDKLQTPIRFGWQLHKTIWGPDTPGV